MSRRVIRRRQLALLTFASLLLALAFSVAEGGQAAIPAGANPGPSPQELAAASEVASLSDRELAGQRVVIGFDGTDVPGWLRQAIERGDVGGVILFAANVDGRKGVRKLTAHLQRIDRPTSAPLFVMVDQEGGLVKRLPGPPDMSAAEMGDAGEGAAASQGRATGRSLESMGVNVDLAPVADVARPGSNLEQDGRAFGRDPQAVANDVTAFVRGVQESKVAATAKHFPGFGAAQVNTDDAAVTVDLSKHKLRKVDGKPFAAAIGADVGLVMVNTIIYPAFDPKLPAALSPKIATGELRGHYGFDGVSVTDALGTPAVAPYGGPGALAVKCAKAGMDLMLYTGREGLEGSRALRDKLHNGKMDRGDFEASVTRALALRADLEG